MHLTGVCDASADADASGHPPYRRTSVPARVGLAYLVSAVVAVVRPRSLLTHHVPPNRILLRDLELKLEYCSGTDDIVEDFFYPCFGNCAIYDRCVDVLSAETLFTVINRFDGILSGKTRIRLVVGSHLGARDITILTKCFSKNPNDHNKSKLISAIARMVRQEQILIRIAVPMFAESSGDFSQRIGIFTDESGDSVAFTGTSRVSFHERPKDFESVDVFTSWNDPERVENKRAAFQALWDGEVPNVHVYDFAYAAQQNILKYSPEWAVHR